jgi:hypothetical protein
MFVLESIAILIVQSRCHYLSTSIAATYANVKSGGTQD